MAIKLSILTPAVWKRDYKAKRLAKKIEAQITDGGYEGQVEHLVYFDNKARTIGAKRQALVDTAHGDYIAFVDDDDDISDDYIKEILCAAESGVDVIVFDQSATFNGEKSRVEFSIKNPDGPFTPGGITLRSGWHVNAWRRTRVAGCRFGETNYGEDLEWALQARKRVSSQARIDKVLHYYQHDAATSEAPMPS